jgi:hypothetical protein
MLTHSTLSEAAWRPSQDQEYEPDSQHRAVMNRGGCNKSASDSVDSDGTACRLAGLRAYVAFPVPTFSPIAS